MSLLKKGLIPGVWTVYAVGKNAEGIVIAQSASASVTLTLGQTSQVSLTCVPYAGPGSLRIDLSWPEGSIGSPVIEASLTPEGGTETPITFTITGDTASYVSDPLQNGYYTVRVKLLDGSQLKWSTVETVLIYKDQPTIANWVLTPEVIYGMSVPNVLLTLSSVPKPITLSLLGYYTDMQVGSTMTVYANGFPTPTSWQWYLDGDPLSGQTASSVTVGVGLEVGSKHTLSVIGKTSNQSGSMNIRFRITDTETKGVTTFAGSGAYGFQDGERTVAKFAEPAGVAVDSAGNVYVADTGNHRIRKISPDGTVTTLAGSGVAGFADGVGTSAKFNWPADVAVDSAGNVYVADVGNNRIRKVSPDGTVTTLAGSGVAGFADGFGTSAKFNWPADVAVDSARNVYVADGGNGRIRKISPSGEVSTIVGTVIDQSGGSQTTAIFSTPIGIEVDNSGNVYVVDLSGKILKITPSAEVRVIAGTGTPGYINGTGLAALFNEPKGIAVGANGILYIADGENRVIRKIVP